MSSVGRKLLSSLIYKGDVKEFLELDLFADLFKESEANLFQFMMDHMAGYGVMPSVDTIEEKIGDVLVDASEPPTYYMDELEKRYLQSSVKRLVTEANNALMEQDPEKAFKLVLDQVSRLNMHRSRNQLVDFREASDLVYGEYMKTKAMEDNASLLFGWPTLDNMTGGLRGGDVCSVVGRPASGKAQPLTAKVLTPTGWTTMGALQVGDKLASVDGAPSEVTGIFPQGQKPVFRLTFQDGRSCEASDEHLWEVWYRGWAKPRILTTVQLIAYLGKARYQHRLYIRLFNGEYGTHMTTLFSPYFLGLMIGDGCFRGQYPTFSTEDKELIAALDKELAHFGLKAKHADRCNYRLCGSENKGNVLKEWLKDMGLWGLTSEEKFLPPWVFRMSREQRLGLLQGLMDSDGTASKNGGVSFCTTSPRLASDVQQLVWSLGGRATINPKRTKGLLAYILHIVFEDRANSFRLHRKAERVARPRTTHTNTRLRLDSIEFVRMDECQCIAVSHPDRLYVTDNYVVTHNTFQLLYVAHTHWMGGGMPLVLSMEMTNTLIAQRLAAMNTHIPLTHLLKGELSTKKAEQMMAELEKNEDKERPFWLVDGNLTATVDDLIMLCRQLKPTAVFIDGAYLLRHPNPKASKWDKLTENAEWIKQKLATELMLPVVCSYQFNREAAKKKKGKDGDKAGLEDIYGTDAIAQLSSVVLGLFEHESVETEKRRRIDVIKGRNGETGEFLINWDFVGMDFAEISTVKDKEGNLVESTEDMQFVE